MPIRRNLAVAAAIVAALILQGCGGGRTSATEPGVSAALAERRAASIDDIRYTYALAIPADAAEPIDGEAAIHFTLTDTGAPLVIDFAPGDGHIHSVAANGRSVEIRAVDGHIVIPGSELEPGANSVGIAFRAGDGSLNRSPDFLYSLFVPARAHHAVPIFDQPDLKARFSLELTVPAGWQAVSNGAEAARRTAGDAVHIRYAETEPIPSYLFAFAAGRFEVETAVRGGREFRMLHRETDAAKVERNRGDVFDLHAAALDWLER